MSAHPERTAMGTYVKSIIKKMRHLWQHLMIKLLLVASILIIALITYLKIRYSPDQCVRQFITAIDSHDYQTLETFIFCDGVDISSESLLPFVNLYHSDAQFRQDIRNTLNRDLSLVNLDTYNTKSWIKLISHRKFFVKTYTVQVEPIFVTMKTNLDSVTVVYSNHSQIISNVDGNIGIPLLPGLYQFDAIYFDPLRQKDISQSESRSILSNQEIDLSFDCSNLVLNLPDGYQFDSISIDGIDVSDSITLSDETVTCYPVFTDEVITLNCIGPFANEVATSFMIPDDYVNETYQYSCDFTNTSMEFRYEPGLTIKSLKVNEKKIKDLSSYQTEEGNSFILSDLENGTTIDATLKAPWGETFSFCYTVTDEDFDEYIKTIDCHLSDKTKDLILRCAANYYLKLCQALNEDDIEYLWNYSEMDDMANDFYVMLENIQYDYETYSEQYTGFEEDIKLEPKQLYTDANQLDCYSETMALNLNGIVTTISTTTNEDSASPTIEMGENQYNVTLHIIYDCDSEQWLVTAGYYNYDETEFVNPINLLTYE